MLGLFRTNQLILGVFLLGYALLLRLWLFFASGPVADHPEYTLLSGWFWRQINEPFWLPTLVTTVLIWLQAVLINSIVAQNRIAPEINLFPGLFYVMISSALPAFQEFSPLHLANTFIILAIGQVFRVYKQNRCIDHLFNAGLFIGLASLCYSPYILFLAPLLFGLNILRAYNSREWLATIIGGWLPLLWLGIFGYLSDNLGHYWATWLSGFGFLNFSAQSTRLYEWIGIISFAVLILIILFGYNTNMQKTIIEVRKKIDILYLSLFFGMIVTLFSDTVTTAHLLTVAFPASVLLSFVFTRMSKSAAELIHLFLLIGILLLHYLTYAGII